MLRAIDVQIEASRVRWRYAAEIRGRCPLIQSGVVEVAAEHWPSDRWPSGPKIVDLNAPCAESNRHAEVLADRTVTIVRPIFFSGRGGPGHLSAAVMPWEVCLFPFAASKGAARKPPASGANRLRSP